MSRAESDFALRGFDAQVDAADDNYDANAKQPAPVVLDATRPPIYGERPAPRPKEDARG